MAKLNFPDPNTTQTYTAAGITWTWNADKQVWSSEGGSGGGGASVSVGPTRPTDPVEGDLWWADSDEDDGGGRLYVYTGGVWVDASLPGSGSFLSKTNDDTAAGAITFEGPTTHEGGIITGGTIQANTAGTGGVFTIYDGSDPSGAAFGVDQLTDGINGSRCLIVTCAVNDNLSKPVNVIQTNLSGTPTATEDISTFQASFTQNQNTSGDVNVISSGVQKSTNSGSGSAYFLNAPGDAPSYHAGTFKIGYDVVKGTDATLGQQNTFVGIQLYGYDKDLSPTKTGSASFNSNAASTLQVSNNSSGASNRLINFWVGGSSGVCGKFYADSATTMTLDVGNGGNFVNTSDYRAKTNVSELGTSTDLVKALRPVVFNYTGDTSKTHIGFIAHELQQHVPTAVVGEKDAVDEEGNPEYQGTDVTKLIPLLTKALQESLTKIDDLETRLAALEGA